MYPHTLRPGRPKSGPSHLVAFRFLYMNTPTMICGINRMSGRNAVFPDLSVAGIVGEMIFYRFTALSLP